MSRGKAILFAIFISTAFIVTGTMDYNSQTSVLSSR